MMDDKDWLKGLQNKMKDYEEPAPEGLWEDIESSVFHGKKRRVIALPVFWRSVAAAAVVALGVFAGLRLFQPVVENPLDKSQGMDKSQETLASGLTSSVNNDGGRESSVEIVRNPESETLLADSRTVRKRQAKAAAVNDVNYVSETEAVVMEAVNEKVEARHYAPVESVQQTRRPEENEEKTERVEEAKADVVTTTHDGEDWSEYISAADDSKPSRRKAASLDVSLSSGSTGARNENRYDLQMFYRGSAPTPANGLIDDSKGFAGNDARIHTRGLAPIELKRGSIVTSNSDHKRPVRLALTVNYPISGRFGLETGAMLTTLHSTFSTEAGRTLTETDQTLRYVGIPLNMTASLVDAKWFSLYLGGGGMVEKCISGKSVTTETLAGIKQGDSARKSFGVKPLLWSLNASAGLQAKLTKNFGLYVEPGLSYHFDDNSDVQTIYKERPLDFMLTFGVRFSLR